MSDIGRWLDSHGLGKYTDLFIENEIDLEVLPELQEADLKDLDLPLGTRKKILKGVRELDSRETFTSGGAAENGQQIPSGEAERRQLTVMFCDLVGSTRLSESMDTEDYRDLLGAYQTAATSAIREHDGYVARYMGDGLLVYFGYPAARENDPERAARAGLAVVGAVAALDGATPLQVRVGIATGPVVVGDIVGDGVSEEAAVLGETPNLAARLQGFAGPGTVLLSPMTHELLRGVFEMEALDPVELKGLSRPIAPYRAIRPRAPSEVNERRFGSSSLVGRDVELALLKRAWNHAQLSEGQSVLIQSEPGVGKSRLLQAFNDSVGESDHIRIRWYCSPYYQNTANYPAIEHLKLTVESDKRSGHVSLDWLASMVEGLELEAAKLVPPLALLLSVPLTGSYELPDGPPEERKRLVTHAQVELLCAAAKQAPVLFLVEDLHWADPTTLEVLGEIIEAIRDEPVLMLMTARPEFNAPWVEQSHAIMQKLSSLRRNETMKLVQEIVEERGFPLSVIERIVERTDGVPLFVEELCRSAMEAAEHESVGEVEVPATLRDALTARLDRLGPAKRIAQLASVIGRQFSLSWLESASSQSKGDLESALAQLVDSGLVHPIRTQDGVFAFKHALVRDTAYETLLRSERQELHAQVASVLEPLVDAGTVPQELAAHHHAMAGRADSSFPLWYSAGLLALDQGAHEEAASLLEHALEQFELSDSEGATDQQLRIVTKLAQALFFTASRRGEAVELLDNHSELVQSTGDRTLAGQYFRVSGLLKTYLGLREEATFALQQALEISEGGNDPIETAMALAALGTEDRYAGRAREAVEKLTRAIQIFESRGTKGQADLDATSRSFVSIHTTYLNLGFAQSNLGEYQSALASTKRVEELTPAGSSAAGWSPAGMYCQIYTALEQWDKVVEYASTALISGAPNAVDGALLHRHLTYAVFRNGDLDAALDRVEATLELSRKHSSIAARIITQEAVVEILVAAGRLDEAAELANSTFISAEASGSPLTLARGHRASALVSYGARRFLEARAHFEAALGVTEHPEIVAKVHGELAAVLFEDNDPAQAADHLRQAREIYMRLDAAEPIRRLSAEARKYGYGTED